VRVGVPKCGGERYERTSGAEALSSAVQLDAALKRCSTLTHDPRKNYAGSGWSASLRSAGRPRRPSPH